MYTSSVVFLTCPHHSRSFTRWLVQSDAIWPNRYYSDSNCDNSDHGNHRIHHHHDDHHIRYHPHHYHHSRDFHQVVSPAGTPYGLLLSDRQISQVAQCSFDI